MRPCRPLFACHQSDALPLSLSLCLSRSLACRWPSPVQEAASVCLVELTFCSSRLSQQRMHIVDYLSSGSRHSEMLCRALLLVFRARVIYGFRNKPAVGVHSNVGVPVRQARLKGSCCGRRCGFDCFSCVWFALGALLFGCRTAAAWCRARQSSPLANFLPNFHISTTRRILSSVANRKCQGHEARIKRNYEGEGMQPREKQKDPKPCNERAKNKCPFYR